MKTEDPVEKIEPERLEQLLSRIKPLVSAEDYVLVEKVVRTLMGLTSLIRAQGATIVRLRGLVGRSRKSEKTSAVIPPKEPDHGGSGQPGPSGGSTSAGKEPATGGSAAAEGAKVKGRSAG